MKYFINKAIEPAKLLFSFVLSILGIVILMSGCVKFDPLVSPRENIIFMPQATSKNAALTIFRVDSAKTATFGAALGGFNPATKDIEIIFEIDNSLVSRYNADHSYLDYNFVPLPSEAFTISGLRTIIQKGHSDSDPLSFTVYVDKLDKDVDYCLPIKIKTASDGKIDSAMSITYFSIDSLFIRKREVTSPSTIFVSNENDGGPNAGEGSSRLVDNDINTKFLSFNFNPDFWIDLQMAAPLKIDSYSLTSGDDAPERDPKDWTLQGSNDHIEWTVLDRRSGFNFASRQETVSFELNHPDGESYLFYRLAITANGEGDGGLFQMSEWKLFQYY